MTKRIYKSPLGFSKYLVSNDGQSVINIKTQQELSIQFNKGNGYCEISLSSDTGTRRVGIHRLVALAFLEVPENYESMTVNHKDGIKTNNFYTNLEWCTYRENQEHAGKFGLTDKCTPVTAVNVDDFSLIDFPSILRCSEFFKVSKDVINYRVKSNGRLLIDRYAVVKTTMLVEFLRALKCRQTKHSVPGINKAVFVKDLHSGEEMKFENRTAFAEFFDVSLPTVSGWLKSGKQIVIGQAYLVRIDQNEPWIEFTSKCDQIRLGRGRPVVLICEKTGEQMLFQSSFAACKAFGLKPTCVNYRLSTKGNSVFSDGYRYVYQDELDTVRLPLGNG